MGASGDLEPLDQRKQPELVHVREEIGPQGFLVPPVDPRDKGAMEMRNGECTTSGRSGSMRRDCVCCR